MPLERRRRRVLLLLLLPRLLLLLPLLLMMKVMLRVLRRIELRRRPSSVPARPSSSVKGPRPLDEASGRRRRRGA